MAKFAAFFIAAMAFQVTLAGVVSRPYESNYFDNQVSPYEGYKTGEFEAYATKIQILANEVSASFQYVEDNNLETLTWQGRELAQAVEQILDRLQTELNIHNQDIDNVLEEVFSELRQIQVSLQQKDNSETYQLQRQLSLYVREMAHQIQKLVHLVQYNFLEAQGSLYATIQSILSEFLVVIQNIRSQPNFQNYEGGLYSPDVYQGEYYSHKYRKVGYPMNVFGFNGYKFHQVGKRLQAVDSDSSVALQHFNVDNMVARI